MTMEFDRPNFKLISTKKNVYHKMFVNFYSPNFALSSLSYTKDIHQLK